MNKDHQSSLFYIYAPKFRENAAGIKVLHYLCEELNKRNCEAYLVLSNPAKSDEAFSFETPALTKKLLDKHHQEGRIPIVIYSETIPGNPLNATRVVRYFLNYPGALDGNKVTTNSNEWRIAYSSNIRAVTPHCEDVLYVPAVRINELPQPKPRDANLNLMYAGKYRAFVGEPKLPDGISATEIFRRGKKAQPRSEVLDLLAKASKIYLWENSTIGTEAVLLGTACIFIPNPFLGQIILGGELGSEGYASDASEKEVQRAIETLPLAKQKYEKAIELSSQQIEEFISKSKNYFSTDKNIEVSPIKMPSVRVFQPYYRIAMFLQIMKNFGLRRSLKIAYDFGYISINKKKKN